MSIGFLFWILFILGVGLYIFGFYSTSKWDVFSIFLLVQVFLLGWGVFGSPIRRGPVRPSPE